MPLGDGWIDPWSWASFTHEIFAPSKPACTFQGVSKWIWRSFCYYELTISLNTIKHRSLSIDWNSYRYAMCVCHQEWAVDYLRNTQWKGIHYLGRTVNHQPHTPTGPLAYTICLWDWFSTCIGHWDSRAGRKSAEIDEDTASENMGTSLRMGEKHRKKTKKFVSQGWCNPSSD